MTSELTVYESGDFGSIRAFEEDGQVWFVASDVAKTLGYREAEKMTRSLEEDEKDTRTVGTPGGNQEMTVVNEPGLYHAILMRKAACVKDPYARGNVERFQRWVTHEVLPAIRRTGSYGNPLYAPTFEERMALALRDAADVLARREARIRALEESNEAMRPMAELGEAVSSSDATISMGELARLLRRNGCAWAGRNRLFARMREDGYLMGRSSGAWNQPKQRYVDQGLFEVAERTYPKKDGTSGVNFQTRVTGRGQAHFLSRYAGVGS